MDGWICSVNRRRRAVRANPGADAFRERSGKISMTFHTPRWVARTIPVAALGLALVSGLAACSSNSKSGGGNNPVTGGTESTSQICADLTSQGQALANTILGSMGSLNLTDPNAAASAGPQVVSAVKTALGQLVGVLHAEAGK